MVVNSLNTTVRKVDLIRTLYNPGTIVRLLLTEGSPRVFVSHTIIVGVRGDLTEVGIGVASVVSHSMYRGHTMYSMAILGSSQGSSEEATDVEKVCKVMLEWMVRRVMVVPSWWPDGCCRGD